MNSSCWTENVGDGGNGKKILTHLLSKICNNNFEDNHVTSYTDQYPDSGARKRWKELTKKYAPGRKGSSYILLTEVQVDTRLSLDLPRAVDRSTVYLSKELMNDLKNGSYPWYEMNKNYSMEKDGYEKRVREGNLFGGFLIPVRVDNGAGVLAEVHWRIKDIHGGTFWERIEENAMKIKGSFTSGVGFRSVDVANRTMFIRPTEGNLRQMKNGVSWNDVTSTFKQIRLQTKTDYKFLERSTKGYIMMSTAPFGLYETWMKNKDYAEYIELHPDRQFPQDNAKTREALDNADTAMLAVAKDGEQNKRLYEVMDNTHVNLDQGLVWVPLNTQLMDLASGKRTTKGVDTQNKVMGQSADEVASKAFGWKVSDKSDNYSAAEHLHVCGFANGGLTSGPKAYRTSQIQHNLVVGTSETNSVMLRYERAIIKTFQKEKKLRALYQQYKLGNGGASVGTEVLGELKVHLNQDGPVYSNELSTDGKFVTRKEQDFNDNNWFMESTNLFTGLAYHMDYQVTMFGESLLFNGEPNPTMCVELQPFARPFYSKGEALADDQLLELLFKKALEKIEKKRSNALKKIEKRSDSPEDLRKKMKTSKMMADPKPELRNDAKVFKLESDGSYVPISSNSLNGVNETHAGGDVIGADGTDGNYANGPPLPAADAEQNLDYSSHSFESNQYAAAGTEPLTMEDLVSEVTRSEKAPSEESMLEKLLDLGLGQTRSSLFAPPSPPQPVFKAETYSLAIDTNQDSTAEPVAMAHVDELQSPERPAVKVEGVVLRNLALVTAIPGGGFADIPVAIKTVDAPASGPGILLMPEKDEGVTEPTLLVSSQVVTRLQVPERDMIPATPQALKEVVAPQVAQNHETGITVLGTAGENLVLSGDIETFMGVPGLRAKLYTLQSADPEEPLLETAIPDLSSFGDKGPLGVLLPNAADSIMREVPLRNIKFTYSERDDLVGRRGLYAEADLRFEGALSCVQDMLDLVLGPAAPKSLHIAAFLGQERLWDVTPLTSVLRLQGSFDDLSVWLPGKVARLTTIGVEVSSVSTSGMGSDGNDRRIFGYGLFGSMELYMGSEVPLEVHYKLDKAGDFYHMGMLLESDTWTNILGVENLTLTEVTFETSFRSKAIGDSLTLRVSAMARLGSMNVSVAGFYSKGYSYLEAEVGNLTIEQLGEIYQQLVGEPMSQEILKYDIKLESLALRVSTDGLVLSGAVSFNEHSCAQATISITKLGLAISGSITDITIPETNITVKEAGLDIFIGSELKDGSAPANNSRFALKGMVEFNGLKVTVGLVTGQGWMVYGRVASDMSLAELSPALKSTFLENIILRDVALIASNQKQEDTRDMNVLDYPIGKGIQLCARVDKIDAINKMASGRKTHSESVKGMVLVAAYTEGEFKLAIVLNNITFDLSDQITFGNLALAIEISKNPTLKISGDLTISMKDQKPLIVGGAIHAGVTDAGGSIETKTVWKNPLGVCEVIEIRKLAIDLAFNYALGIQRVGIAGNVAVGDVDGGAACVVGTSHEQLVKISLNNLHVAELIHFVGQSFDIDPLRDLRCGDFLVFLSAGLYFSTGTSIGSESYPAGISANGTLVLFGKTASFKASIGTDGLIFKGGVDNFFLGPLEVRSATGAPQASLDFTLTKEKQHFKLDGMVKLWTFELKMLVNISAQPPVAFFVWVYVDFGSIMTMELMAEAKNIDKLTDLSHADLIFSFEFKGDPLGKICEAVLALLDKVQEFGTETFEVVEARLRREIESTEKKQKSIMDGLGEQRRALDEKCNKRDAIISDQRKIRDAAQAELEQLEKFVQQAEKKQSEAVREARRKLEAAEREKDEVVREKKAEYQQKLRAAQQRQSELEAEQRALEHKKFTVYRAVAQNVEDELQKYRNQDGFADALEAEVRRLQWKRDHGGYRDRAEAFMKLPFAEPAAFAARSLAGRLRNAWNVADASLHSAGYKDLVSEISEAAGSLTHVGMAISKLVEEGESGFIREMLNTEERKVQEARDALTAEQAGNSNLTLAIQEAQDQLDRVRGPELRRVIDEADARIRSAEQNTELAVAEARARSQAQLEADVRNELQNLQAMAKWAKEDFRQGSERVKDLMRDFQKVEFRITGIKVAGRAREMAEGGALTFSITGVVDDQEKTMEIKWSPLNTVAALYKEIVKQAVV
ncbi:MAG: hypothetical protein M1821_008360 [Bathelium mastoideum]|nr:MAG: hypothetical protein M1821_008360 [Bathelium mastoideum]